MPIHNLQSSYLIRILKLPTQNYSSFLKKMTSIYHQKSTMFSFSAPALVGGCLCWINIQLDIIIRFVSQGPKIIYCYEIGSGLGCQAFNVSAW